MNNKIMSYMTNKHSNILKNNYSEDNSKNIYNNYILPNIYEYKMFGGSVCKIKINIVPLSIHIENDIVKHTVIKGFYGKFDENKELNILNKIKHKYKETNIYITIHLIRSIRFTYTTDKIIFRYNSMKKQIDNLYENIY